MASSNKMLAMIHIGDDHDPERSTVTKEKNVQSHSRLGHVSSNISTQRQDPLQQDPGPGHRNIETPSDRDWELAATPRSVGDSPSAYCFEPQGELRALERGQRSTRNEFNMPHAVASPGMDAPSQSTSGASNSDGATVPPKVTRDLSAITGTKRKSESSPTPDSLRPADKRTSLMVVETGEQISLPSESQNPAHNDRLGGDPATWEQSVSENVSEGQRRPTNIGSRRASLNMGGNPDAGSRQGQADSKQSTVLPARKVFPIQIGDKLFRLSGASISSDAPSYFSQFFEEQLRQNEAAEDVRTLYIDRDPATFEDIALHLQGYHIEPRDGPHFVKLFADAQFFSLPRLTAQLFSSTIYIRIGDEEFQIPRDLFSNPGDTPNYFSLGFSVFFSTPSDVFPGLSQRAILRPPPILPPSIPLKSAKTFADLLHILKGYPVEIRNEEHRQGLIRDARYFHLKGLEQRLIPHTISYNLARKQTEIVVRLEDIRQSGISFVGDNTGSRSSAAGPSGSRTASSRPAPSGWIHYQRPYVDSEAYSLIVEIGGEESTFLSLESGLQSSHARLGRATFHRQVLARITSLFSVITSKMNLPIMQPLGLMMLARGAGVASLPASPSNSGISDERVKVRIGRDADVVVDGKPWCIPHDDQASASSGAAGSSTRSRRSSEKDDENGEWIVRKAQWRLRVQPVGDEAVADGVKRASEVILGAVKIEAFSNERSRNADRGFLS